MCGIAGILDLTGNRPPDRVILERMVASLRHRGPDGFSVHLQGPVGLGAQRLSLSDPLGGAQPMQSEDGAVLLVCNGEVFRPEVWRDQLSARGHVFRTRCDVEILLHRYAEYGLGLIDDLDAQFALALYDAPRQRLLLMRDPFGISPLFYANVGGQLLFASEIKALLEHPELTRAADLVGLDCALTFPGLVSPRTAFCDVRSLPPGHRLIVEEGRVRVEAYWDMDYPRADAEPMTRTPAEEYPQALLELLRGAVAARLVADAPVGVYLSGGLDSALIAALARETLGPSMPLRTFSVVFPERRISEASHQRQLVEALGTEHTELSLDTAEIAARLPDVVAHAECPLKETYNACALALAEAARATGVKAILAGQGADELFAGYPGYRFDRAGRRRGGGSPLEVALEEELCLELWGQRDLFYERRYAAFRQERAALFSPGVQAELARADCLRPGLVRTDRLAGRDPLHQRSYLDLKLRLGDHLLGDHGDRMCFARGVEGRYPFLARDVAELAQGMPPDVKLRGLEEKWVVKQAAQKLVPSEVVAREKFGFRAPASPALLGLELDWVEDLLDPDRIARQGYFDPHTVGSLRAAYSRPGAELDPHLQDDLLLYVITFGLLCERFGLPSFGA